MDKGYIYLLTHTETSTHIHSATNYVNIESQTTEFKKHLTIAFEILLKEEKSYLEKSAIESLNNDLKRYLTHPENIIYLIQHPINGNIQKSTLDSIETIAKIKFESEQYADSLALYILLTTLIPENADIWCRAGIAAHENESYELATRLFTAASTLDQSLIYPWVYSAHSYLQLDLLFDAEACYAKATEISLESSENDPLIDNALRGLQSILQKHA